MSKRNIKIDIENWSIIFIILTVTIFDIFVTYIVCTGNFWCLKKGVLEQLQKKDKTITQIKINRNIFSDSIIAAKSSDTKSKIYCLDSNILFKYKFKECR